MLLFYSDGLTAADVVSNLSLKLNTSSCSRFNINRANVWDGALRGFKRSTYLRHDGEIHRWGWENGRGFGHWWAHSRISYSFDWRQDMYLKAKTMPNTSHSIVKVILFCHVFYNVVNWFVLTLQYWHFLALEDDEYFHVGRMIAVSIVFGGPGPRCLPPNFFLYLVGKVKAIEATIEDIPDDEVRKALLEVCCWLVVMSNFIFQFQIIKLTQNFK